MKKRNRGIVKYANKKVSFAFIGKSLGLSRERIRQIYKEKTGRSSHLRNVPSTDKIKYARKIFCSWCGTKYYRHEGESGGVRFCCTKCRLAYYYRDYKKRDIKVCYICRRRFFPYRNRKYMKYKKFLCNLECVTTYLNGISKFRKWVNSLEE